MSITLADIFAALALIGLLQALLSCILIQRLARSPAPAPETTPPITILKPLHGADPLLEEALTSQCQQDYPKFQIICGLQDPTDPARAIVERLRQRFPNVDLQLVINPTPHGTNRKIANLINMLPAAKYETLVISDADIHAPPDYLRILAATLAQPGVGLATTGYVGLPASRAWPALLGTAGINHIFLPGTLLARAMGRQDCLGATMTLRRATLAQAGGLEALADHLADDNILGQHIRALGLDVALAPVIVATTVPETTWHALWRHELRWGRTIRALAPRAFAASTLQFKLVWAALAVLAAPTPQSLGFFAAIWLFAAFAAHGGERALAPRLKGLAFAAPVWLLPLREALSFAILLASYAGNRVEWRGQTLSATTKPTQGPQKP